MAGLVFLQHFPFFIVGSGRSGSTLLRIILASHSTICIPPETWYIIPLVRELPLRAPLSTSQLNRAVSIMTSHYRWPDMGISKESLMASIEMIDSPTLRDILDIIYDYHLRKESKVRWGDKTPPYVQILPELSVLYPEAVFINLIRDGHDVAKSFNDLGWYGRSFCGSTSEWKQATGNLLEYRKNEDIASKLLEVKYEDLIQNMPDVIKSICSFLKMAFEEQMLSWPKDVFGNIPKREIHIHKKLSRRPTDSDAFKWKRDMPKKNVLIIESHIHRELKSVAYTVRYDSICWQPLFLICRIYCEVVLPMIEFCHRVFRYLNRKIKNKISRP